MNTNTAATETTIAAEDAPLGVQLWPTISPEFADNFTLTAVKVVRTEVNSYVHWMYRGASADRYFEIGEQVVVRIEA